VPVAQKTPLLNRELSRLDYNRRVLAKAEEAGVPPLERLRFLAWCSHNLDEFFMVRAGATRDMLDARITEASADGLMPIEQMEAIRAGAHSLLEDMYRCLNEQVLPELRNHGVIVESFRDLAPDEQQRLRKHFRREIAPVLTPLAIDPGHPFPFIANLTLNIAAGVDSERGSSMAMIKLPRLLARFVRLGDGRRFVPIGSIIMANLGDLLPTLRISRAVVFRVIRNAELSIDEDVEDLRLSVEAELRRRERKQVVCLEVDARADDDLLRTLVEGTRTLPEDVYRVDGFLGIGDLMEVCDRVSIPSLKYPEFNPRLPQRLAASADMFSIIRAGDVLLHRPYESFTAVIELLHAAAIDPNVVAIKQTLYQTDERSPIVDKLAMAAMNGKQVTVVIELQARFEEKRNIALAQRLHDAGAQVVYGILGVQTHAKMCVIIRREADQLRHYVHLSTGNYNVVNASAYTDLDLLTCHEGFGAEASQLINVITGYSATTLADVFERAADRPKWNLFVVAPFDYQRWLIERIGREAANATAGKPARIVAKLNSLIDPQVVQALYDASTAGVKIDLIVRSMCTLIPGVVGVSEKIRVISIVDRFLEHSRIIRFENGGTPEIFLSSGDWMPRNFQRRIELTFPLLAPATQAMAAKILDIALDDTASSWELGSDGHWTRRGTAGGTSSQQRFIELTRSESLRLDPYAETVKEPARFRRRVRSRKRTRG
jgi:polyphosphate kinase